ncbi:MULTISPECIES: hypothetical protein [Alkalihalophilus]|uniref:Uncharacterized protein n=1 Tax=Alkalihalophilus pseudofirmus TaxID=79885 RepID=A0AAJ2U4D8_ALKPS|nr:MULTISPECIES: hypothetical protein [Alkalihalophilus]MCM3490255.1 hypothetical protein [Alkalihalophilus marmarensis]MDV2886577.1 hypothetical protein [Alkalihalophilus pseudofirmus]MEC2072380.1 hypothetical protein [Alkalihalophilus marmarensis]MED1599925.1 hypothetical protein [Alkalihalophilus marmarensis]WEG17479.1 hypothetical protein PQ478_02935 [Alkalihalophilus pseudofirmus]
MRRSPPLLSKRQVSDMSQKKKPKANAHHSGHKHANNHKTSSSANKQNGYH